MISFTIQVYWYVPLPYLADESGNTVDCIYTEGEWTLKVFWKDNDNLLSGLAVSDPVDLFAELN